MYRFTGPDGYEREINVNNGMYSDTTPMVKPGADVFDEICQRATTMTLWAHSLVDFITGMFLVDAIDVRSEDLGSGYGVKNLVLPYLPGARQDRVNPTGDVLYTAASVADMINVRCFHNVVSIDPHSHVMPDLIHNFVEYPLERVYQDVHDAGVANRYDGVIAPDHGAVERATLAAEVLGVPVIVAEKQRDVSTGHILNYSLDGAEAGKHYLVVDDICDGGMTFQILGGNLRSDGATADLYVTHGIFKGGADKLVQAGYGTIYRTDSFSKTSIHHTTMLPVVKDMEAYRG